MLEVMLKTFVKNLVSFGVPLWHGGLRISCCHSCGLLVRCCGVGSIPGLGTFACHRSGQHTSKEQKNERKKGKEISGIPVVGQWVKNPTAVLEVAVDARMHRFNIWPGTVG